jgi:hypothetical protein
MNPRREAAKAVGSLERISRSNSEMGAAEDKAALGDARFTSNPARSVPAELERGYPAETSSVMREPGEIARFYDHCSDLRHKEFQGRRPYHFLAPRLAASGRWEIWMDDLQAAAVRGEQLEGRS